MPEPFLDRENPRLIVCKCLTSAQSDVTRTPSDEFGGRVLPHSKALVFPGQGSQSVGMGKALGDAFPEARAVFDEVDTALGESLSRLMFEGSEAEMTLTANTQPALMAVSVAVIAVLKAHAGLDLTKDVSFVAGHSLGEYSALAAAGAISISDTARLLRLRGQAMQDAVAVGRGAMAAVMGLDNEASAHLAEEAAKEAGPGEVCEIANDNGGGQIVVSGSSNAVGRAVELAKAFGAKRTILLPVSAPFHCSLMKQAADVMARALEEVRIRSPEVPLIANVLAKPVNDPASIRDLLVAQVTGKVRWRESVEFMAKSGVDLFIECGAGKVLTGLLKRIAPSTTGLTVGVPADIEIYRAKVQC